MSKKIKVLYPAGSTLAAYILSPDGESLWNIVNAAWDNVSSLSDTWSNYIFQGEDAGGIGAYLFTIPSNLPANNAGEKYSLIITNQVNGDKTDPELGGSDFYWDGDLSTDVTIAISSFSSIDDGDAFFNQLLYKDAWSDATDNEKQQALNQATFSIKRLPFAKWVDLTNPPSDIVIAQYYEAFELLNGVNLESELRSLRATSRGISSVRSTYDSTLVPDHLRAGLVSAAAWSYLTPYVDLTTGKALRLNRVS